VRGQDACGIENGVLGYCPAQLVAAWCAASRCWQCAGEGHVTHWRSVIVQERWP
jgi:hypothetical protein